MDIYLSEIIKKQAILNIGCTGHVANGKSTIIKSLTGISTQKFKNEKERNITINIGYAGCKIYYSELLNEFKFTSSNNDTINLDSKGNKMKLMHHFSFIDCPGHEAFMNNMITGTAIMDMAFLVEDSSSNIIPQVQTYEHLIALLNTNINDVLVLQNKCDLVSDNKIYQVKEKIDIFLNNIFDNHELPIIPCIAQKKINLNYIGQYIINKMKTYNKNLNKPLLSSIIRTFDINKQNIDYKDLKGGIIGSSIIDGVIKIGDYLQISPGIIKKNNNNWISMPIYTKVVSLSCENQTLDYAIPGGLIGIGTELDPFLCKANKLVGQIITYPGKHPPIIIKCTIKYNRFKRNTKYKLKDKIKIKIGILGSLIDTIVNIDKEGKIELVLEKPVCLTNNKLTIIYKEENKYKIIGIGEVLEYKSINDIIINKDIINKNIIYNYNLNNDLILDKEYKFNYNEMLNNLKNYKIKKEKINIVKPIITKHKNNKQFIINNFNEILESVTNKKDTINFKKFFLQEYEKEINIKSNYNNEQLVINGRINVDSIINSMIYLLTKFKKCIICNSTKTFLIKQDRLIKISCESCDSINTYI